MPTKFFRTPPAKLSQRHAIGCPAADVPNLSAAKLRILNLPQEQVGQISRVQCVAHLMTSSVEAQIFQRTPQRVRADPKRVNTLLRHTELRFPGEHSATIHNRGEVERVTIFEGQCLGS